MALGRRTGGGGAGAAGGPAGGPPGGPAGGPPGGLPAPVSGVVDEPTASAGAGASAMRIIVATGGIELDTGMA